MLAGHLRLFFGIFLALVSVLAQASNQTSTQTLIHESAHKLTQAPTVTYAAVSPPSKSSLLKGLEKRQQVRSLLPQNCNFSADFVQSKQLTGIPAPLVSSGKVTFFCEQGLVWQVNTPFEESMIYTQFDAHFKVKASGMVQHLDNMIYNIQAALFLNMLSADVEYIFSQFDVDLKNKAAVILQPIQGVVKKAIATIHLSKTVFSNTTSLKEMVSMKEQGSKERGGKGSSEVDRERLIVQLKDTKDQVTKIVIANITPLKKKGGQSSQRRCEQISLSHKKLCNILFHPDNYIDDY